MSENNLDPQKFLPLSPSKYQILVALADARPKHGYAIMQEVAAETNSKTKIGPSVLYTTLKQMLDEKLIEEAEAPKDAVGDDARRKYYRLTGQGGRVLKADINRMNSLIAQAQNKLGLNTAWAFNLRGV